MNSFKENSIESPRPSTDLESIFNSPEWRSGRVELEHLVQVGLDEEPVGVPGAHPSDLGTLRDTTFCATEPESGAELPGATAR